MTNPTTFSYTFSANPAPRKPGPEPELFAVDRLSESAVGTDQLLARNPRTGRELVVPRDHFDTLVGYCSVFRTLEEHVAELMEGSDGAPERAAAIRAVVQSFRDGGLTISAKDICRELAPTPTASPTSDKPVVVIITCDRPLTLERLLGSVLANCDLDAIDCCFVVDDSRSEANGARNLRATIAAARETSVGFHYFGASQAQELMHALIAALPEHEEAIRFSIDRMRWKDHKTFGLARNFSQLLSVGKPVIVFDDDALCEGFEAPFQEEGIGFSTAQREAEFYAEQAEWRGRLTRRQLDPIAGHMECLGLPLPDALSVLGVAQLEQQALRLAPRDLGRWLTPLSTVLITECGSLGDPGTGSNIWLATLPSASRERLAGNPGGLEAALKQRCTWLGRSRPTFCPHGSLSQVTGFDNRVLLPPYFPIMRGEDRLFGLMTGFVYPFSIVLDYPWAVPHVPMHERNWTNEDNRHSILNRFPGTMFSRQLHDKNDCPQAEPKSRLCYVAGLLANLAAASDETLLDRFAQDLRIQQALREQQLQKIAAKSARLPVEWQNYLNRALLQVRSSRFDDVGVDQLKGTVDALEGTVLLDFWRQAWRSFSDSLNAWYGIRNVAREFVMKNFSV